MKDMKRRSWRMSLPAIAFAALVSLPAAADIVYLTDGTKVEGEVTVRGDRVVVRKTSGITVTYEKWRVKRIEKRASAVEDHRTRREALAPDDAAGWLAFARWCAAKDLGTEAEQAYRVTLSIASPVYRDAKMDLAGFLEKAGRLKEALVLYEQLGEKTAARASSVRATLDERRSDIFVEALGLVERKKFREAVRGLERAYGVTPPGRPATPGAITEADVVAQLVGARKGFAESVASRRVSLASCPACSGAGSVTCRACGGKGEEWKVVTKWTTMGVTRERKLVTCETCRGATKVRCGSCAGATIDVKNIDKRTRGTVRTLADRAFEKVTSTPDRALELLGRWVAKHPLAFGEGAPRYGLSGKLRTPLKEFPPSSDGMTALKTAWGDAKPEVRGNFLACYGLELAKLLSSVPRSLREDDADNPAAALASAKQEDAALLSALPARFSGKACRVVGVLRGLREGAGTSPVIEIDFKFPGTLRSGTGRAGRKLPGTTALRVFAWKPAAGTVLRRLGAALGLKGLASRARVYPCDELWRTLGGFESDDRVELVGRFYHDEHPVPESAFEVWGASLRLDEEMERAVAMLSRRVTFRFRDTPLDAAAEMLAELTGAAIELDVPGGLAFTVTARARKEPLGRALARLVAPHELRLRLDGGRIAVTSTLSAKERRKTAAVMRLLPRSSAGAP